MNEKRTRADFRRRGLARRCGAAFVLRRLEKGLVPHWDAMTKAGRGLALQLGFVNPRPCRAVCREEKGETAR